jgi:hypothetical protein
MPTYDFAEIKPVEITKVWPNEATDFTPWLVDNINRLGEALGMELEVLEREADVGEFSLDVKAKDLGSGRTVVIENQLTRTDHAHLGKLLTYAGGLDAGVLVWIAEEFRDPHRKALEWLNERTGEDVDCFGVIVEVIRIDESRPAFNFRPIVFPNQWQKHGRGGGAVSPRAEAYREYFQGLIDELRTKHKFTGAKVAQPQSYYSFSSGVRGITLCNAFAEGGRLKAEVYIDLGDKELNKNLFDRLREQRLQIEKEFGESLSWERLDDRRACRVAIYRPGTMDVPKPQRDEYREWSIERLLRLKRAVVPRAKELIDVDKAAELLLDQAQDDLPND